MGIVTKRGDGGMTSLYCGRRVPKDDIRIEACGTLDELSSYIGLAKSIIADKKKYILESIQKDLIIIGSEIATPPASLGKLKRKIDKSEICRLEGVIKKLEDKSVKRSTFCLPGENFVAGNLDVARTVARRAERNTVTLMNKGKLKNRNILIYLNRLSDLLYLLARKCENGG